MQSGNLIVEASVVDERRRKPIGGLKIEVKYGGHDYRK